ncbi:hypothetical protein RHMOL_Rhmol10G0197300 [Rhododendron molle]|uniref:Uncharacterized protein n=1 Tax=Rhododendron molle TaxID=49168 RepID=A0ACC0M4N9_RHOML|nr:hypothetical protein RHMOL_Rhmol10G0197300 [Rhododendron molle]
MPIYPQLLVAINFITIHEPIHGIYLGLIVVWIWRQFRTGIMGRGHNEAIKPKHTHRSTNVHV